MWNQLKTIVLLGALSAVLVAAGGLLGEGFLVVSLALALLLNAGAYFYSDRVVLAVTGARPLPRTVAPDVHAMVDELAARAGIPVPRVYLVDEAQPNAFATGRNPRHAAVAVTRGLLELLDQRELRAVLAHEIGHVRNRDILVSSVAATLSAAVTYVAHVLSFGMLFGDDEEEGGGGGLLFALFAPFAATLVQLGISRSREYLADEEAARLSGDPLALASALRKLEQVARRVPAQVEPAAASLFIVNPFASGVGPSLASLFSTHPSTAQRVARLEALARRGGTRPGARWPRLARYA